MPYAQLKSLCLIYQPLSSIPTSSILLDPQWIVSLNYAV